jgi:hypothetical protein
MVRAYQSPTFLSTPCCSVHARYIRWTGSAITSAGLGSGPSARTATAVWLTAGTRLRKFECLVSDGGSHRARYLVVDREIQSKLTTDQPSQPLWRSGISAVHSRWLGGGDRILTPTREIRAGVVVAAIGLVVAMRVKRCLGPRPFSTGSRSRIDRTLTAAAGRRGKAAYHASALTVSTCCGLLLEDQIGGG